MRIAITGATGNVGAALVRRLLSDDDTSEVVGIARRPPGWHHERLRWEALDMAATEADRRLPQLFQGIDAVVHLAWAFQPTHRAETTWAINVVGGRRVLDAAAQAGVGTLIHASSVGAYSPGPDDEAVDESWPTDALPVAGYGREKAYMERVLDAVELRHPDMRVVRMRPGFIFQREAAHEQRKIFAGALLPGQIVARRLIPVLPWPGDFTFQALHTEDAAEAYRLALRSDIRGAVNIAAEPVITADHVAELVGAQRTIRVPVGVAQAAMAAGWRARILPAEPALLELAASLPTMDCSRARDELGWVPRHTAVEAVDAFVTGLGDTDDASTPAMADPLLDPEDPPVAQ